MTGNFLLCLFLSFCLALTQAAYLNPDREKAAVYHGYKVLRVSPQRTSHLHWLRELPAQNPGLNLDFWSEPTKLKTPVDLMVAPEHVDKVSGLLNDEVLPYQVLVEDIQDTIDRHNHLNNQAHIAASANALTELMADGPGLLNGVGYDFRRYMRYNEIMLWLEHITQVSENCRTVLRCEVENIGKTHEGRDMNVIKISARDGQTGKWKVWVDAGIHAREWVSPTTSMYFIQHLIEDYTTDPHVNDMINEYDFVILPLINGDGYEYTHTTNRLWRKSRTKYPQDECYGTDINRNFDHMWSTIGISRNSCDQTYSGPTVHSEVESRNMADYILGRKGEWLIYLTLHSYSQLWMAPWGYTKNKTDTYDELMRVADASVAALTAVHGTPYRAGAASEILYESSGTSRDWAYGTAEIPYVYTIELRPDSGNPGFLLPPEEILPTGEETWEGFKMMVRKVMEGP